MMRRPPISPLTDTLFPSTTPFRPDAPTARALQCCARGIGPSHCDSAKPAQMLPPLIGTYRDHRGTASSVSGSLRAIAAQDSCARATVPPAPLLMSMETPTQIGSEHVGTPVTNAQLVCLFLLEKQK